MNVSATLETEFRAVMGAFAQSPAIKLLAEGGIGVPQYRAVLREIYHYSKEDPQIQALATVYFRGQDRSTVKMFLKHAASEIGHELLALADLEALGEDVSTIPTSLPLPTTIALTAFPFYQIQYRNPIGYLGYLYFLEYMPTQAGAGYVTALQAVGIPREAMSFLHEHMTVDVGHNKLMQGYLHRLVRTDSDLVAVIYAMRVTAHLYAEMLNGAIRSTNRSGMEAVDHEELARWTCEDAENHQAA